MNISLISLFFVICFILVVIILIYFKIYKTNCNEALKGDESHKRIPHPSKVSSSLTIIGIMMIILGIAFRVSSLNSKLDHIQRNMFMLQNQLNAMQNDQAEFMNQQESILESFDYWIGELDLTNYTVPVSIQILPKEYNDETEVLLDTRHGEEKLKRNNGVFVTTLSISIFDDSYADCVVVVKNGDERKTEIKEEFLNELVRKYLPSIETAYFTDREDNTRISDSILYVTSNLELLIVPGSENENVSFTEVTLITEVNGKVVDEKKLMDQLQEDGVNFKLSNYEIKKKFEMKERDEVKMYIRAVDTYGFIHKSQDIFHYKDEKCEYNVAKESIYSKDGVELW